MAISLDSLRHGEPEDQAPVVMVYGGEGEGKTTFAAGAPGVVFAQFERGLGVHKSATFGLLQSFSDICEVIGVLANDKHDFRNLAVDSADWLEKHVHAEACRRGGWTTIEQPGYGTGYNEAINVWNHLIDGLDTIRNQRGIGIVLIAHASIRKFTPPDTEPYDNYSPKLHESAKGNGANPLLREYCDAVFFINRKASTVKDKTKGDKAGEGHARGVGGLQRIVYTEKRPAYLAKNRWGMPPEIILPNDPALAWPTVAQFIPYYCNQVENV